MAGRLIMNRLPPIIVPQARGALQRPDRDQLRCVSPDISRIMGHRSIHGDQAPGSFADEAELMGMAGR